MSPLSRPAGPVLQATLIVDALPPLVQAYGALGLTPGALTCISAAQAQAWGQPALEGLQMLVLSAAEDALPLLRLVAAPGTPPRPTRHHPGWMALEILVRDVDALAPRVAAAGFEIVGPPADLDVSPAIRAMQAIGLAGEMLYLTQVKQPVPPFEIPLSAALPPGRDLGALFIAVMSTPSRESVIAACQPLQPGPVLRFETKVTVLNRALGRAPDQRWPVATVQWAGASLFEIDEVQDPAVSPAAAALGDLPAGLAWVTMQGGPGPALPLQRLSEGAWLELLPALA
ncbi:MAG: hypothetical protein JNJ71_03490 [Rubrivivax sp.]|nr:hypothetical protein [Rubrivivax sp.]